METTKLRVELLQKTPQLASRLGRVFGRPTDTIMRVVDRAGRLMPASRAIVWEGDPQTFQFTYVSPSAEHVLGYPVTSWLQPNFWAQRVVHPEDQADAVAYCALATGRGMDHDFQYRARTAAGGIVLLHDVVHVIKGPRGVASKLRGIMIPLEEAS